MKKRIIRNVLSFMNKERIFYSTRKSADVEEAGERKSKSDFYSNFSLIQQYILKRDIFLFSIKQTEND